MLQPSHIGPYPPWARVCIKMLQKPIVVGSSERLIRTRSRQCSSEFTMGLTVAELMNAVNQEAFRHNWNEAVEKYSLAMAYLPKSRQEALDGKEIVKKIVKDVFGLSVISLGRKEDTKHSSVLPDNDSNNELNSTEDYTSSMNEPETEQSNVIPLVCVLENNDAFFFVEPFFQHGLQDVSMFSPAVVSHSTIRLMYIIYQVLNALNWYHKNNVTFGKLSLDSIRLDKGLFLYLTTPLFKDILVFQNQEQLSGDFSSASYTNINFDDSKSISSTAQDKNTELKESVNEERLLPVSDLKKPEHDLLTLVDMWVRDEISNYDYLMALNYFAGRRQGDPNYHPLFPWVTDFTDKNGGFRDLTKTKFRLNKGDNQLDMTYKQALFDTHDTGVSAVAHHVSDVLSDITYHAYLARRTPVSVLCEHLRSNWVPNEYPSSMQRLYTWTPDECIPQFYSDPTIFKSIHDDLPDLALPSWTPTAEDFIRWHRSVLESEEVSGHLHQWIDLTFGYKLSGKAAVKAKNVCLHLVNKHQIVNNYGVVQLFSKPHPSQAKTSDIVKLATSCHAPLVHITNEQGEPSSIGQMNMTSYLRSNLNDSLMSLDSIEDSSHDAGSHGQHAVEPISTADPLQSSSSSMNFSLLIGGKEVVDENFKLLETEKIYLPEDCTPLQLLDTYESIHKFKRQFPVAKERQQSIERPEVVIDDSVFDKLIQTDIEWLGCLIVEMVLPEKVRLVSAGLTREQRAEAIKHLCSSNPKILPRFVRSGVLRMLKLHSSEDSSIHEGSTDYRKWENEKDSLPSLSTGLLLHPQTGLFPFPSYFRDLHSFLVKFTRARLKLRYENPQNLERSLGHPFPRISLEGLEHCFSNKSEYSTLQVDIATELIPSLLPELDDEGIHLLLYHLEPLFLNQDTRLYAFTHLFDLLAQAIGPKVTVKTFLKPLIELYDSKMLHNYEHLAAQSFLSQIIVRFGLETFLIHFASFVVDAVAFELMLQKTKRSPDSNSVNSNDGITVDGGESESEKLKDQKLMKKQPSYPSDDDDEDVGNAPFSDQDEDDYIPRIDEPYEEQERFHEPVLSPQEDKEDALQEEEKDKGIFVDDDENKDGQPDEVGHDETLELETEKSREDEFNPVSSGNDEEDGANKHEQMEEAEKLLQYQENFSTLPGEQPTTQKEDGKGEEDSNKETTEESNFEGTEDKDDVGHEEIARERKGNLMADVTEDVDENGSKEDSLIKGEANEEEERRGDDDGDDGDDDDDGGGDDNHSGDEADDESSGNLLKESEEDSEPKRPSADVFYQDTKQDNKEYEPPKEDLSTSYVSGIAAESVMWLAPRLGPILTSKYFANQLLTMLPQCYIDVVGVEEYEFEDEDRKAKWVLYCLGNFCALYGEAFVLHQYLPYAEKIIKAIHTKFSARGEASLAATFALLKYCIPYMSKETFVDNFETLFKSLFQPVLRILSSWNTKFPGGGDARAALCHNYVDLLTVLSLKLERELARELMIAPLQQFFSCFELVHLKKKEYKLGRSSFIVVSSSVSLTDSPVPQIPETQGLEGDITKPEQVEAFYKTSMYEELCQTFSAAMAHHAFVPLCGIMGSKFMEASLYNHDLIWNLCCQHDPQLSHPRTDDVESCDHDDVNNGQKLKDDCDAEVERTLVEETRETHEGEDKLLNIKKGSRLRTPSWLSARRGEKRKNQDIGKPEVMSASDQYLRGSWLEHWEHQLVSNERGQRRLSFDLRQTKLQTFTGHSGPVRSIYVQDSEHFFLSASKDKTVKLWSLSNHGDGTAQSASSWTYQRHSRGVFTVDMIESVRQAVSCDGSVHVWDPVNGSTITILEPNKNSSLVAMAAMPAPSQSVVVATSEATARFIDVRQSRFVQEWKTTTSSAPGLVRDICCSPDGRWVALGFTSGLVSVLDVRGGLLRSQRRAHTSDVVQVRAFSNNSLLTSSMDQGLSLWKDDGLRLKNIKGHTEPLHLLIVQKDYILSSSIANRIGVHITKDEPTEGSYIGYKLSSEVLRGNVTSLGYLQLNQLLLLGSDTGNITLCA
ncbi:WD repeat-containing protein 81-like isoform X2 [Actinia tenebrosa]|nr:WD repeat-containing protein 81-like isoform X2 [Actinia tenebrosa]